MASRDAFTLVEVVMIMVVIAILVTVASVRSVDPVAVRAGLAAGRVSRDLRYARNAACTRHLRTWVVFDASAGEYRLYAGEDRVSRTPMIHPVTKSEYVVRLDEGGHSGVKILDVDFRRMNEVAFDSMGTPYDRSGRPLASDGMIGLTGGIEVTVGRDTGIVKVER